MQLIKIEIKWLLVWAPIHILVIVSRSSRLSQFKNNTKHRKSKKYDRGDCRKNGITTIEVKECFMS